MRTIFEKVSRITNTLLYPEVNAHSVYKRCHVESIAFDQFFGRGATSVNRRLARKGFIAMMTPEQFFRTAGKNADDYKDDPAYAECLTKGRAIASPYIYIDFQGSLPVVRASKGLHRMGAILSRYGDIQVPVIIRPLGPANPSALTEKHLMNLRGPFYAGDGRVKSPTGIERVYLNGRKIDICDLLRRKQQQFLLTR